MNFKDVQKQKNWKDLVSQIRHGRQHDETPVRECWDCGAHWPEDVMKKDKDENWYCQECYYPEPEPDLVDFMDCKRGDR